MEPNTAFNLALFLDERIQERGVTLKRLSELSGISPTHLEDLVNGKFDRLPPAPYIRGYLAKLAPLLEFDAEVVWREVKYMNEMARSGPEDTLPRNRFAKRSPVKYVVIGVLAVLVIWYLVAHLSTILGKPTLNIDTPREATMMTTAGHLIFRGTAHNTTLLTLNGESIPLSSDGAWEKDVALEPGLNTIEIEASKSLGSKTSTIRQVFLSTSTPATPPTQPATSTTPGR